MKALLFLIAPRLTDAWGQAVVVENRAGASGTIGDIIKSANIKAE